MSTMQANEQQAAALLSAGFSYEYPGFWLATVDGYAVTIADGIGANNFPWEWQVSAADMSETFGASEGGFSTVEEAIFQSLQFVESNAVAALWNAQGFYSYNTGGGCLAFHREYDGGAYILITAIDDADLPARATDPVSVGFYDSDGQESDSFESSSSQEAILRLKSEGVL